MLPTIKNNQPQKSFSVQVPSRGALAGNPSDVAAPEGTGAVLAIPLWRYIATVAFLPSEELRIDSPDFVSTDLKTAILDVNRQGTGEGINLILAAIQSFNNVMNEINQKVLPLPFRVSWSTTIPRQRGMSGSSAIITACLKGLINMHGLSNHPAFIPARLGALVTKIENETLNIAAGLQDRVLQAYADQCDALYMDFSTKAFEKNSGEFGEYVPIQVKSLPALALLISNQPSHSGKLHTITRARLESKEKRILSQMRQLASLAKTASHAFNDERWSDMGQIMTENAKMRFAIYGKEVLGQANLDMLDICKKSGCHGNFTGSGGAMIVYLPEAEASLKKLTSTIKKTNAKRAFTVVEL